MAKSNVNTLFSDDMLVDLGRFRPANSSGRLETDSALSGVAGVEEVVGADLAAGSAPQ